MCISFVNLNYSFMYEFISLLELNPYGNTVQLKQITALLIGLLSSKSYLAVRTFFIPSLPEVKFNVHFRQHLVKLIWIFDTNQSMQD
jgi:hypothetical protein